MRLRWIVALCFFTALSSAVADSSVLEPLEWVTLTTGDALPLRVLTNFNTVEACHLVSPDQHVVRLLPEDQTDDRFELNDPNVLYGCQVTIKNVNVEDNGVWKLYYTSDGDVKGTQYYNVTVLPSALNDIETSAESKSEEDDSLVFTYRTIEYGARIGTNVSLTLSRQDYTEQCFLRTPQGVITKLEDVQIEGVLVFPTKTNFVSCRVIIGPMDNSLLGSWTLCGKHTDRNQHHERCQSGNVSWAINDPTHNWASTVRANFDHVVHYGFTLEPIVRGTGTVNTCHVVTPEGEDIVVTEDSDYPGLRLVEFSGDPTACSVTIGAIDPNFLGSWVLYGTYNSINMGFNVVTQPMTFSLYDENNPYSQAYNVTHLDEQTHVISEGHTVTIEVRGVGATDDCIFITNTGQMITESNDIGIEGVAFTHNSKEVVCRIRIGPVTKNMFGDWLLSGKFRRNNILFFEFRQPFRLIEEDPANPHPSDVNRIIEYLNEQQVFSSFGSAHTFTTALTWNIVVDSCHVRTPNNLQYILREGESQHHFEHVTVSSASCAVRVHVDAEEAIGDWMLIARLTIGGVPTEQRLPFTVHVEVNVTAVPESATIAEGNDLYVRLVNPTTVFSTCTITGPTRNTAERDDYFVDTCGFIVKEATLADAGVWEISYGNLVKYRAHIRVDVTERYGSQMNYVLTWTKDEAIETVIGPDDVVYCKVEDPFGNTIFEEFDKCRVSLDRVASEHEGVWKSTFGRTGRILTENLEFVVKIAEAEAKAVVETSVVTEKPLVTLSCRVPVSGPLTACKFRDPTGRTLLGNHAVGEGRYTFSLQSNETSQECALRITDPLTEDLGQWRCVMETDTLSYYGFLSVLCPWAMQDPAIAASVVSVPTLTAETPSVNAVEGDAVTLRCSVESAIRYCYFRAPNGTVYNIRSVSSDWFEYAGLGLDAGECSIRFPSLRAEDSGTWSCHVGFLSYYEPEQRTTMQVQVKPLMTADQQTHPEHPNILVVSGQVYRQRTLEYCRFVRIDGAGFTSEQLPSGYEDHCLLANGKCEIWISNPTILDHHPWTVVAKVLSGDLELARSTDHSLSIPGDKPIEHHHPRKSNLVVMWASVLVISMALLLVGLLLGPEKNRQWTRRNASFVRDNIRSSFMKKRLSKVPLALDQQISRA